MYLTGNLRLPLKHRGFLLSRPCLSTKEWSSAFCSACRHDIFVPSGRAFSTATFRRNRQFRPHYSYRRARIGPVCFLNFPASRIMLLQRGHSPIPQDNALVTMQCHAFNRLSHPALTLKLLCPRKHAKSIAFCCRRLPDKGSLFALLSRNHWNRVLSKSS